jgi:cytochrome c553
MFFPCFLNHMKPSVSPPVVHIPDAVFTMRHRSIALIMVGSLAFVCIAVLVSSSQAQKADASDRKSFAPEIPKTWDDEAMATLEVPLANPVGSPKHVSADYYYHIPVRPIYKSYPVYVPDHESPGYMEWLKQQEPEIVWGLDPKTGVEHTPPLKTEADWIKAGEMVFDSPIIFTEPPPPQLVRQLYEAGGRPVPSSGIDPFVVWVIRQKGKVEAAFAACADCHTRVLPDGSVIKGAQGNNPIDHGIALALRGQLAATQNDKALLGFVRLGERSQFEAPWLQPFEHPDYGVMSVQEIASTHAAIPAGVFARQGTSVLSPPHIPDLIGVKAGHYLDATGLQKQRSIVDLMRYAALNQGADMLANYDGFIPADIPNFKKLPDPDKLSGPAAQPSRYSDEQLYALAQYVYSLQRPSNPNKLDAVASRGQKVFEREACAMCHTPPLYTNNKLTLAEGFIPPPGAEKKYDILPISVGTDPSLALRTRRGTGYYKVPSLKGVWYRTMFGHSGWCATLEDWFDPRRTRDDYIPTGFKPYGAESYAVKGHPFGLNLSEEDRKALIAFLKTL